MKNILSFILLFLAFIGMFSCRSSSDSLDGVVVNLSAPKSYLKFSKIVADVQSLHLELPYPYFWGIVNEVIYKKNKYFVVDKKQNLIFCFAEDGTFLNTIGKRGQGPGEYNAISSFFVNDSNAFICDIGMRAIHQYSYGGNYQQTMPFSHSLVFDDIAALSDGSFLCHRPSDDELCRGIWIMDKNGKKVKVLVEYERGTPYVYSGWNTIYTTKDGGINIYNPVDGSYYRIDTNNGSAIRTLRLIADRKMLGDLHCSSRDMLNTKEKCAYSQFIVDSEHQVLSLWVVEPESKYVWTTYNKENGNIDVGTMLKMDLPGYSEMGRPVSSNIPNTMVTIYTDEFPKEMFPDAYKKMNISETTAVLCLLKFK